MPEVKRKKCKKCKKAKPLDCFSIDTRGGRVGKRMSRCKPCLKEDKAEQHQRRKEREKAAHKASPNWQQIASQPFNVDAYPHWLCPAFRAEVS